MLLHWTLIVLDPTRTLQTVSTLLPPPTTLRTVRIPKAPLLEDVEDTDQEEHRSFSWPVSIRANDTALLNEEREQLLKKIDGYLGPQLAHADELVGERLECYRTQQRVYFPNCNAFHENGLVRTDYRYLGSGYFRNAFVVHESDTFDYVFKSFRLYKRFEFGARTLWSVQKEATIFDNLASSPRLLDLYGHCGVSLMLQAAAQGDVEREVVPSKGFFQHGATAADSFPPHNNMTLSRKLDWAVQMAESLADLHGYEGGVMLHGDVHPVQWLRSDDNLYLNDFGSGALLEWSPTAQDYCQIEHPYSGTHRSPEELRGEKLNEQTDVYSLANVYFALLTGLYTYYEHGSDTNRDALQKIKQGVLPIFDEESYRNRSPLESAWLDVIHRMWIYDPEERATIFDVVRDMRTIRNQIDT